MSKAVPPDNWAAPDWHPDFGDANAECEHLRALSMAVLSGLPGSFAELVIAEPGLMFVRFLLPDETTAEVYSVSGSAASAGPRYALFLSAEGPDEREFYADCVSDAIKILRGEK